MRPCQTICRTLLIGLLLTGALFVAWSPGYAQTGTRPAQNRYDWWRTQLGIPTMPFERTNEQDNLNNCLKRARLKELDDRTGWKKDPDTNMWLNRSTEAQRNAKIDRHVKEALAEYYDRKARREGKRKPRVSSRVGGIGKVAERLERTDQHLTGIMDGLDSLHDAIDEHNGTPKLPPTRGSFIVTTTDPYGIMRRSELDDFSRKAGQVAERSLSNLAKEWLGKKQRRWYKQVSIDIRLDPKGSGGATVIDFDSPADLDQTRMKLVGTPEELLANVIPHEVMHLVLAAYHRRPIPRWIDEGICTACESEQFQDMMHGRIVQRVNANKIMPVEILYTAGYDRRDIMDVYDQGSSIVKFLIERGGGGVRGKQRLVKSYLLDMFDHGPNYAAKTNYGFDDSVDLQQQWLTWLKGRKVVAAKPAQWGRPEP